MARRPAFGPARRESVCRSVHVPREGCSFPRACRYIAQPMRSFCIVVQRGHEDLYAALRQAFRTRPGFYVVLDRRKPPRPSRGRRSLERRTATDEWGGAHFLIAECGEPF